MNELPKRPEATPDHRFNQRAYQALLREQRSTFNREVARRRMTDAAAASRDYRAPRPTVEQIENRLDADAAGYASAEWSDFDLLAFRRANAAIIFADGLGLGVSAGEADALDSREPAVIAATARKITRNLRKLAGANEADSELLLRSGLACEAPATN